MLDNKKSGPAEAEPQVRLAAARAAKALIKILEETCTAGTTGRKTSTKIVTHVEDLQIKYCPSGQVNSNKM